MQTENTQLLNNSPDVFLAKPPTMSKVLLIIYFKISKTYARRAFDNSKSFTS